MRRIGSVDFFRVIAMIFIIAIHTGPFKSNAEIGYQGNQYLHVFINQIARFAVPFFFIISGYFYGKKNNKFTDNESTVFKEFIIRIGRILIFWNLIYLFPFKELLSLNNNIPIEIIKLIIHKSILIIKQPKILFFEGSSVHLWFLYSLIFSVFTIRIFLKFRQNNLLYIFAIFCYVIGVFAGAYKDTILGLDLNFDSRDAIFFSLIFFLTGYRISFFHITESWIKYGILMFIFGSILHFFEIYNLNNLFKTKMIQDYVFGTYFMGLGVAIVSLSNHKIFNISIFNYIGKKTLGVYAIHFIFAILLKQLIFKFKVFNPLLEIGFVFLVYSVSFIAVELMSKNRFLKKVVM